MRICWLGFGLLLNYEYKVFKNITTCRREFFDF